MQRALSRMADEPFDLLVVGGGIHGAWTARHAARRGLRVALAEAVDYAAGTTSRSTMLAHGGLRYLAHYDIGLVREALHERAALTRMAPHLVQPIPFLLPFYEGAPYPKWQLKLGIRLYGWLARGSGYPTYEFLSKRQVLELEPGLREQGLEGGAMYYDGQILSPERLTTIVARDAAQQGARLANHARVTDLLGERRAAGGVVEDAFTGEVANVRAQAVVNTTGPFLDRFLEDVGLPDDMLRLTKGIHLATPPFTEHAVVVNATDGRTFFAVPWRDHQWVGTTDTDYTDDPREVHATAEDVAYLQDSIRTYFPDAPVDEVRFTNAGLRNLLKIEDVDPGAVPRRHEVHDHTDHGRPGLVSLVGGKLTTARTTALDLLDAAEPYLARRVPTDEDLSPLPGGRVDLDHARTQARRVAADAELAASTADRLVRLYGAEWVNVAGAGLEPVAGTEHLLLGEAQRAIETESARTVEDVLRRRTLAWAHRHHGLDAAPRVAELLQENGIPTEHAEASIADYEAAVERDRRWRAD